MRVRLVCTVTTPQQCAGMLTGLARASYWDLRDRLLAGRPYPALYRSGVRYQSEPPGREQWQLPWQTYRLREGDCEDLVAWRVAELWLAGERGARAVLRDWQSGVLHCLVRRADGSIEDPSKLLGMRGAA